MPPKTWIIPSTPTRRAVRRHPHGVPVWALWYSIVGSQTTNVARRPRSLRPGRARRCAAGSDRGGGRAPPGRAAPGPAPEQPEAPVVAPQEQTRDDRGADRGRPPGRSRWWSTSAGQDQSMTSEYIRVSEGTGWRTGGQPGPPARHRGAPGPGSGPGGRPRRGDRRCAGRPRTPAARRPRRCRRNARNAHGDQPTRAPQACRIT